MKEFEGRAAEWAVERCKIAGMGSRERKASREDIPLKLKRALPAQRIMGLLNGEIPSQGFGIGSSETGCGKTFALAAILREAIQAHGLAKRRDLSRPSWLDSDQEPPWLVWESWPSAVAWFRMNATSDRFGRTLDRLIEAPVLFLDDLGSERIKGSYVEDFAASQLDLIVDERHREERPIFYTTNLDEAGLSNLYGARLVSRLLGDNPLFFIEGLPDLRVQR